MNPVLKRQLENLQRYRMQYESYDITPPPVKIELHAYGEVHDISYSLANMEEILFVLTRDDESGVFSQLTYPFSFVHEGYDLVKELFDTYSHRAKAQVYIYFRKDRWFEYDDPTIYDLDFASYYRTDDSIEIETFISSLYEILKSKSKVVFDIPVAELKQRKQWKYERIDLHNNLKERVLMPQGTSVTSPKGETKSFGLGISYEVSEVNVLNAVENQTIPSGKNPFTEDDYFLKIPDTSKDLNVNLELNITGSIVMKSARDKAIFVLSKIYNVSDPLSEAISFIEFTSGTGSKFPINWQYLNEDFLLKSGEKLYLYVINQADGDEDSIFEITLDGTIDIGFVSKNEAVNIDVIPPLRLLNRLVYRMYPNLSYTVEIEDFNNDNNNLIMIMAAESIRGLGDLEAKVHTNYYDFVMWMNTLGYEQHVELNRLVFRKREKGFVNEAVLRLNETHTRGFIEAISKEYLYSGIKIGYTKQSYDQDNVNTRFEFNGIIDYNTDLHNADNILNLTTRYRADPYGIEFLAQERGKDTTSNKVDKDIFIVNVKGDINENTPYETIVNRVSGNTVATELFNGNLNPRNLLIVNESYVAIGVNEAIFAASDSNSEIIIDGQAINENPSIDPIKGLFDPTLYEITSGFLGALPSGEQRNGVIEFIYKGDTYRGFIDEISKLPAWESATTWILRKTRE